MIMEILSEYANFIQWAHMRDNCHSSIKLYCNQLRSALVWSSFRSRVALSQDEISHIAHFNVFGLPIRQQYQRTMEKVRDTFKIIQQKTGNKAVVDIDRYSVCKLQLW